MKAILPFCVAIGTALATTGCQTASTGNTYQIENTVLEGTVSDVDGNKVELEVMTGQNFDRNGFQGMPDQHQGKEGPSEGNMPDNTMPEEGMKDEGMPNGEMPEGQSQGSDNAKGQKDKEGPSDMNQEGPDRKGDSNMPGKNSLSERGGEQKGQEETGEKHSDFRSERPEDNSKQSDEEDNKTTFKMESSDNNKQLNKETDNIKENEKNTDNKADNKEATDNKTDNNKRPDNNNNNEDNTRKKSDNFREQGKETDKQNNDNKMTIELTLNDDSILKDEDGKVLTKKDIDDGDQVEVEFDKDGEIKEITVKENSQKAEGKENSGNAIEYNAANTYSKDTDIKGEDLKSTGEDENAALIKDGANVNFTNVAVERKSDKETDGGDASFYGVGAAILTTEGTTTVKDSKIETDATGGAGVFSYGKDSTAYVSDTKITTKQGSSGGIHVSGGGTLYAWNNTVETSGGSSAAIRSDRGGGTMIVDGGSYTANGQGSPAIYSTAGITVHDAKLTSTASEGVCIEGKNTVRLYDCDLTSSMTEDEQNDNTWNLIVYQSMSGDAEEGTGTLIVKGGSITAKEGGIFYTTNTDSVITLSDVDINYPEETDYFLRCTGNANKRGWGESGSNGANCTFTADNQIMKGDIIYDSISNLDFYMINGSELTGAFIDDETCADNGGDGTCNVTISKDSTWVVTADSKVNSLSSEGKIVDEEGNAMTIKDTNGKTLVNGNSKYTVTVSSYSDKADTKNANSCGSFSDFEVAKP